MSQTILVTFKQYPNVVETIHVKLLVEEWSMVQALHQGLIALFALLTLYHRGTVCYLKLTV
jgi:hypothetical protein